MIRSRVKIMDCVKTLHMIMRDPDELKRAQADFAAAWVNTAMQRKNKPPRARFVTTGRVAERLTCPAARRIILTTEKEWSGK